MKNIGNRLKRLEQQGTAKSFYADVFGDIQRNIERLTFHEKYGRWPPEMTPTEIESFEHFQAIIGIQYEEQLTPGSPR